MMETISNYMETFFLYWALIAFVAYLIIRWYLSRVPLVDESNCTRRWNLLRGECHGPCQNPPPCTESRKSRTGSAPSAGR